MPPGRSPAAPPPFDRPPFFIIGAPRSGTTYLQEVVNRHPDLFITNETRVMVFASRALNTLAHNKEALLHNKRDFLEVLREHLPLLVARYYERLGALGHVRWGDKHPQYADPGLDEPCLDTIDTLFPGSAFVHILREPHEVVNSIVRKGWTDFDEAIAVWRRTVEHAREFGARVGHERYLELHYRDLVTDGVGTTARVLRFLDMDMHPRVEAFLREQEAERTPFSRPMSAGNAIGRSSVELDLSVEQIETVYARLSPMLAGLGYSARAPSGPSKAPVTVYQLTPEAPANPYFSMLHEPLSALGWQVRCTTDVDEVAVAARRREGPLIVHLHQPEPLYRHPDPEEEERRANLLLQALGDSADHGAAIVHTLHNAQAHDGRSPQLARRMREAICRAAAMVIVHAEQGRPLIGDAKPDEQVVRVPHPNYVGVYGPPIGGTAARAELAFQHDEFIALMLGNLRGYKGHERVMRAFKAADLPHARLAVVGARAADDEYVRGLEAAIERTAPDRIRLVANYVEDSDVSGWLAAADVAVFGFDDDMLASGSAMLALSYGVPAIVPRVGDLAQVVEHGTNGFHYTPGDERSLARSLVTAATTVLPERGPIIGSVAQSSPLAVARRLGEVYERALRVVARV